MKLAVITGASSGIGAAAARQMAAEGYQVVLIARTQSALDKVAAEIGANAVAYPCDASDGAAVLAMAEQVRRDRGVPDLIINSAGAGQFKWIEDTSPAEAVAMMQAPYFAAFNLTHAFMRDMLNRNSGVIIHVGSPASLCPMPSGAGYNAARWALRGLHESLCLDLHGSGVRSCHVVFGKVSTGYFDHNPGSEEKIPGIAKMIRTITPEECAKVIARVARKPRQQVFYPFMLRMFAWNYALAPWLVRWLMRRTGAKRPGPARPST